jgi:hypothetical protein
VLINEFINTLLGSRRIDRHFSNTQVFEKWSKAKMTFLLCVVEKVADRLFQYPVSGGVLQRRS